MQKFKQKLYISSVSSKPVSPFPKSFRLSMERSLLQLLLLTATPIRLTYNTGSRIQHLLAIAETHGPASNHQPWSRSANWVKSAVNSTLFRIAPGGSLDIHVNRGISTGL